MGQLSDQDIKAIHKLAPLWQPVKPLWWRNPLDYRLELISQPAPRPADAPPTCELEGCRYGLYRPGMTDAFAYCTSHRDATALVVTDALARHQQRQMAIAV